MEAALPQFLYLLVLGIIFGFIMAFGIGANDVANAFGSSVAARSLTLLQAIIVGSICEFAGSILLGASVAGTIRGKIINADFYTDTPEIFMLGSCTALIAASIWLLMATYLQLPVSTTHTIVAAMLGFSIAAYGFESIVWGETGKVFISWVAAPAFSGIISFIFFKTLKTLVLHAENVFERALRVFPIVVFCAITIDLFFVLSKSAGNNVSMDPQEWNNKVVLPGSLGGGFLCALVTQFVFVPILRRRVEAHHAAGEAELAAKAEEAASKEVEEESGEIQADFDAIDNKFADTDHNSDSNDVKDSETGAKEEGDGKQVSRKGSLLRSSLNYVADNTYRQDLHSQSMHESARAKEIWDNKEEYDPKVERLFSYLQVFTACLAAFAHGSNDVANAIAPVSAIIDIYQTGVFNTKAPVQKWLLAMGGAGIALGFMVFGYRIIKAVGFKLTAITPSRGFCIELAAAFAVTLASFLKLPVSTTQCLVGATAGVGLASGGRKDVDFWFLLRVTFGWVSIFLAAALANAGLFAFVAYSPSLVA